MLKDEHLGEEGAGERADEETGGAPGQAAGEADHVTGLIKCTLGQRH